MTIILPETAKITQQIGEWEDYFEKVADQYVQETGKILAAIGKSAQNLTSNNKMLAHLELEMKNIRGVITNLEQIRDIKACQEGKEQVK